MKKKFIDEITKKYNQSNIESKALKVDMNITLHDIRILSKYLEDELIPGLDNILGQINLDKKNTGDSLLSESSSFYMTVFNLFNEMAEITYRRMVEEEKRVIDNLKEENIPLEDTVSILASNPSDEQRISNIYKASEELDLEREEASKLESDLPYVTKKIMEKLDANVTSLYMPLVIKFVSFLKGATRTYNSEINEAIFSESSLEELLDLDLIDLDIFLDKLTKVKVKIGGVEGFIVDSFSIYNNTTVIVKYPIFITNPKEFQQFFSPLDTKDIKVSFRA